MPSVYSESYYQKHKEGYKRNSKKFYGANKERECAVKRNHYKQNRNKMLERGKKYYWQNRKQAIDAFGGKCQICGKSGGMLVFHQKYGEPHKSLNKSCSLVLDNPEDFVLLCRFPCHKAVHYCMELLGMTWIEVEGFVTKRRQSG